jgi:hypothetical protein
MKTANVDDDASSASDEGDNTKGAHEDTWAAATAVLKNHFDVHEYCGEGCPARREEEASGGNFGNKGGLRFWCKTRKKDMCVFMKKHHDEFMEDEKLRQLFHQCDTQKVEGFNKLFVKFPHKNKKTCCQRIENAARCHLATGIQSVGCAKFYRRIFELTGIESVKDDVAGLFLRSKDQAGQVKMGGTPQEE